MRLIGHIMEKSAAHRFGDYLLTRGIGADIEAAAAGYGVWVHADDHLDAAKEELKLFLAAPDDAKYQTGRTADRLRREQEKKEVRLQRNYIEVRTNWHGRLHGARPLTSALILICVFVGAATRLGDEREGVIDYLTFGRLPTEQQIYQAIAEQTKDESDLERNPPADFLLQDHVERDGRSMIGMLRRLTGWTGFEQVQGGEAWRLITPIFLHFGWLHIVFNMFWLYDLGGAIERNRGWPKFLGLVLAAAIISNIAQAWMDGPQFGGMSGVVYGLLGYVWMKGRYEPHLRLALAPNTMVYMLVWLVVCMTGVVGPIANTAHVVGLLTGIAIGAAPTWWRKLRRSRVRLAR